MNKVRKAILKKIATISKFAAVKAAGASSWSDYYQPKEPKALKNLKK